MAPSLSAKSWGALVSRLYLPISVQGLDGIEPTGGVQLQWRTGGDTVDCLSRKSLSMRVIGNHKVLRGVLGFCEIPSSCAMYKESPHCPSPPSGMVFCDSSGLFSTAWVNLGPVGVLCVRRTACRDTCVDRLGLDIKLDSQPSSALLHTYRQ
ncbi:hypothetical protein LZ31DRAFT_248962 [Colletotrichum somersetense]|nr:hypothetical protein LZ31DRAFT_248962 [Colletotrichum somersetense]